MDLYEFKVSLGLNLSKRETEPTQRWFQHLGSHAFHPSLREVETGVICLGRKRNIRWEKTGAQGSLRIHRDRITPLV